jgi:hypothetical protein
MSGIWTAHTTPTGQTFYYNMKTGVSSWTGAAPEEAPSNPAPAPPPAPAFILPTVKRGPTKVALKVPVIRTAVVAAVEAVPEPPPRAVQDGARSQPPSEASRGRASTGSSSGPQAAYRPVDRRSEYARMVERASAVTGGTDGGQRPLVK